MLVRSTRALVSVDPGLARDRLLIVTVDAAPTGLEEAGGLMQRDEVPTPEPPRARLQEPAPAASAVLGVVFFSWPGAETGCEAGK
jgi:hypothetical protein